MKAIVLGALVSASTATLAQGTLELRHFHLIDGTGAPAREVSSLWIAGGHIASIDEAGQAPAPHPEDHRQLDLQGAFVMPGLIDTHVHVARFPDTRRSAERVLEVALRGGVTTVRDLGGEARVLAEIARATEAGEFQGPAVVSTALFAGEAIFAPAHVRALAPGFETGTAPWTLAIDAQTDLSLAVAAARGAGVAGIKLYGNVPTPLAARVVAETRRQGLRAWAHGTVFPAGPRALVDAGVQNLSHAAYLVWAAVDEVPEDYGARIAAPWAQVPPDHPRVMALLELMAEKGVSLDATLYVFHAMHRFSPQVRADWAPEAARWGAAVTALAHRAGVSITAGTDWFEPGPEETLPHTHQELALLVEAVGLTPLEAITAGTRNGAQALGLKDRGTIEIGRRADLLVLEENPTQDIHNTQSLLHVINNGTVVRR